MDCSLELNLMRMDFLFSLLYAIHSNSRLLVEQACMDETFSILSLSLTRFCALINANNKTREIVQIL